MMRFLVVGLACMATACKDNAPSPPPENATELASAELAAAAETVVIGTKDNHKIYADHVPVPHGRATIVLFHQAGSSTYEFAPIVPRLNASGYSTLTVDLRAGGNLYGPNRTVAKYGKSAPDYLDALPDLEAALNWARLQGQPVILLGSSYSASLVLRVAADNPKLVAAVLAFSPGEYFADKAYARTAAAGVTMPLFITQAKDAKEEQQSKAIFDAVPVGKKRFFAPKSSGVHGASTLRLDKNPSGAEESWQAVSDFLTGLALPPT